MLGPRPRPRPGPRSRTWIRTRPRRRLGRFLLELPACDFRLHHDGRCVDAHRRVAAADEPYITLRLLVPDIRVRESSWIPVKLRDAVLDRTLQNRDVTQPREVEVLGVIAPELAGRDVIVGPERHPVEVHSQP